MKKLFFVLFAALIPAISFAQTWVKVSCGAEFTLALRSDGSLWSWGFNGDGQLGIGDTVERDAPIRIGKDTNWKDIAAGGFHSLALKKDGSLWAWGSNFYGQLGDGDTVKQRSPIRIGADKDWESINASWVTSFAIKKDHSLYTWGFGGFGQTGDTLLHGTKIPTRLGVSSDWLTVSAGGQHVLALKTDHTLWSWGANTSGQLGQGSDETYHSTPQRIGSDTNWTDISVGFQFSEALRSDGSLWTWGFNGNHQLGYSSTGNFTKMPQRVDQNDWIQISAGSASCFAMKPDHTLWAWGANTAGQCGIGDAAQYDVPTQVGGQTDWKLMAVATGIYDNNTQSVFGLHSIGIRTDATSLCVTGANYVGQLGTGLKSGPIYQFTCNTATISVNEPEIANAVIEMMVYPNPTTEAVTITLPDSRNAKVEVFDVLGNTLFMGSEIGSEWHWDLRSASGEKLSAGSYVLRATGLTNEGKRFVVSRQLIVN